MYKIMSVTEEFHNYVLNKSNAILWISRHLQVAYSAYHRQLSYIETQSIQSLGMYI